MKAYKVTLIVLNFDELDSEDIKFTLEDANYPNDCISPTVVEVQGFDIGEWDDDHPLNSMNATLEELEKYPKAKL